MSADGVPQNIISFANELTNWFSKYKEYSNVYDLDHSWISFSIIDSLLKKFRNNGLQSANESLFFKSAVAHVVVSLSNILNELAIDTNVYLNEENDIIYVVKLDEDCTINIERDILDILVTTPSNIILGNGDLLPLSKESNLLVPYILSILTLSVKVFPQEVHKKYLSSHASYHDDLNRIISKQVAAWHERVWPNCHLSHVPEIYLNKVAYPHFLLSEKPPFEESSLGVLSYLKDLGLKIGIIEGQEKPRVPKQLSSLLKAWAMCPDEQISLLAVSLSSVYPNNEEVPAEILASARSKNYSTPLVRESFYKVGEITRNIKDWSIEGINTASENEINQEKIMNMMPWLSFPNIYLKKNYLKNENLKELVSKIKSLSMSEAEFVVSKMLEETPGDIDLRIQSIRFSYLRGELEKAHIACKTLLSEPNADSSPYFLNFWGLILIDMNKPEVASRYFKQALALNNCVGLFRAEVLNNCAYAYILENRIEEAKEKLNNSLELSPNRVTAVLNLAYALRMEDSSNPENINVSRDLLLKAVNLSPFDVRVVKNLFI